MNLEYRLDYYWGERSKSYVAKDRYRLEEVIEFMKRTWDIEPYHITVIITEEVKK